MRRIGRYILNAMTVVSLVLCVAIIAFWVRSYFIRDGLGYTQMSFTRPGGDVRTTVLDRYVTSERGGLVLGQRFIDAHAIMLARTGWQYQTTKLVSGANWPAPASGDRINFSFAGVHVFNIRREHRFDTTWEKGIGLPHWLIAFFSAVAPLLSARSRLKQRRRQLRAKSNQCVECGYDLRGIEPRCPECGTVASKA